jgi:photosystem II stability/assembly factor-like uncharacterized protein
MSRMRLLRKLYAVPTILLVAASMVFSTACTPGLAPEATATPVPTATTAPLPTDTAAPAATATTEPSATAEPSPTEQVVATPQPVGDYEWQRVGLQGKALQDLAFLASGANIALAADPEAAWTSKYDYTHWESLHVTMHGRSSSVAIGSPEVMYVASHTGCASGEPVLLNSTRNGGTTWSRTSAGDVPLRVAAAGAEIAYGAACTGIVKTTDGGDSWTMLTASRLENFDPAIVATSPDGKSVYAAYYSEGGTARIQTSADGGTTWSEITPAAEEFRAPITFFVVPGSVGRPEDGGVYMASSQGVLWFLSEGTSEWKQIEEEPGLGRPTIQHEITALFVDTAYTEEYNKPGPIIYVARATTAAPAEGLGVFRSSNGGRAWEQVGKGLEKHVVTGLALAPHDPFATPKTLETLLAASDDGMWAIPMPPPFR